jgi:hypothetical protein
MIQYFPVVTGSLTVLGNINVSGSITTSGSITISGSITSASFASTASFVANAQSASYVLTAQTASFVANAQTASYVLNAVSSSFASTASFVALAQSASNAVSAATASFANAFTVAGTLTAQTLVVQTITSSVDFVTGSTRFGSILGNTHVFSGSVTMNPGGLFVSSSGAVGIGVIPTQTSSLVFADTLSSKILLNNNANNYRIDLTSSISGGDAMMKFIAGSTGAGEVGFYTTTNLRMIIASSGNVGIGTTSPNQKLEIGGTTRNYAGVGYYSDFAYNGTTYNFGSGETTDNVDFKIAGGGTFTTGGNFRFWTQTGNTTPVERMRISSTGATTFYGTIAQSGTPCQILQTVSNSISGDNSVVIYNTSATGYGVYIAAGSATTNALYVTNYSRATVLLTVRGDGMVTTPAQPAFYAYLPGGATTSTTGNYAGFNTTRLNRGSHYSTSTGRFTAPIAGVYRFLFAALYRRQSGSAAGEISISINGTNVNTRGLAYVVNNIADGHSPVVAELIISLSASDYVMPFIHSVGASSDWYVGENLAYFCGYLIG